MERRAGINGRALEIEIKAAKERLVSPLAFHGDDNDQISYVFNPEG